MIPSPSPSVKIQIMGGKVCLRCEGKTLPGVVNKFLKTKSLLTSPNNVLPYYVAGSKNYFFNRQKKMLKDIKSTLSASLKSIDVSIRSGSITSLSSGKSFVSNFSVKSDSGISLPAPKPMHVQELSNVQERPEIINLPPRLGT